MIFQATKRPNTLGLDDFPNWANVLAMVWLLLEDIGKAISPQVPKYQVLALVQYDRACKAVTREIDNTNCVWSIGWVFCCSYLLWMGITLLEEVLKWLQ